MWYGICMTTATDHIIQAFLEDGGYETVEEWAEDSDFYQEPESGDWYVADEYFDRDGRKPEPNPVNIYGAIEGAIEASEFEA